MPMVTLSRWGNSSGIRIPNQFLKQMNLAEGMQMEAILTPENHILVRPVQQAETNEQLRSHLQTLLSQIKKDSPRHEEIDLGIEGDKLI